MRVVVTGARAYFSLPVIRTLGRRGATVTAADWDRHALGFYSRFTRRRWILPRVADDPAAFVDDLGRRLRRRPHDVVLPLYEEALAIARYRDRLPRDVIVPVPDYATMLRLHDKRTLAAFAASIGVPIPETRLVFEGDDPRSHGLGYPVVLKVPQASSARGVAKVHSSDSLCERIAAMRRDHSLPVDIPVLLQRCVEGDQLCALAFAYGGRPKGTLLYRNVVEYPEDGGAGIVRVGVREREVEGLVERLLTAARWHGVAGFDFMVERNTGRPYLIDANPRFTPAILLAQRSGLDVLGMAVGRAEPVRAAPTVAGLRTRFDPLVALHIARSLWPRHPYGERLRAAADFLRPRAESRSDTFDSDDLCALRGLIPSVVEALTACVRGDSALDVIDGSQYCDYRTESAAVEESMSSPGR